MSWRHGSRTGYIHYRCRCGPCKQANSEYERARYAENHPGHLPRRKEVQAGRFDTFPLEQIARDRGSSVDKLLHIAGEKWREYRRIGMPPNTADHYAVKLGKHPVELWGNWFDE